MGGKNHRKQPRVRQRCNGLYESEGIGRNRASEDKHTRNVPPKSMILVILSEWGVTKRTHREKVVVNFLTGKKVDKNHKKGKGEKNWVTSPRQNIHTEYLAVRLTRCL